mmetsp:Transcript_16263/g.39977  ORF Transcript_16263/g.39977 Transcript_16263/m.39977 type:complete len:289 (-) Transcript_16263:878-1744(-)
MVTPRRWFYTQCPWGLSLGWFLGLGLPLLAEMMWPLLPPPPRMWLPPPPTPLLPFTPQKRSPAAAKAVVVFFAAASPPLPTFLACLLRSCSCSCSCCSSCSHAPPDLTSVSTCVRAAVTSCVLRYVSRRRSFSSISRVILAASMISGLRASACCRVSSARRFCSVSTAISRCTRSSSASWRATASSCLRCFKTASSSLARSAASACNSLARRPSSAACFSARSFSSHLDFLSAASCRATLARYVASFRATSNICISSRDVSMRDASSTSWRLMRSDSRSSEFMARTAC